MFQILEFKECNKCGRRIMITRVLLGVNHTIDSIVTCQVCITEISPKFKKEHPKDTAKLKKWLEEPLIKYVPSSQPREEWKIDINLKTIWEFLKLARYILRELLRRKPKGEAKKVVKDLMDYLKSLT